MVELASSRIRAFHYNLVLIHELMTLTRYVTELPLNKPAKTIEDDQTSKPVPAAPNSVIPL